MPPRGAPNSSNARRLRGRAIGDLSAIADGDRLEWDAGAGEWRPVSSSGGAAALGVGMIAGVAYSTVNGDAPPAGCLWCEGQDVSRVTYAELFGVLGTLWGAGDGSTTFTLPDLRGRTLLGRSAGGSPTQVGATGGSRDATLVAHSHGITDGSNQLARGNGSAASGPMIQGNDGIAATSYTTDSQGSSASDANLPPYAGVRWAIVYTSDPATTPAACVEATGTLNVGAGPTVVTFSDEIFDTDNLADLATDNDRLTVQTAGLYEARASVEWDTNTAGDRAIVLVHRDSGGSPVQQAVFSLKPGAYNNGIMGAWTFDASAGDYFTVEAYQSSGSNRDMNRRQLSARRVA